MKSSSASQEAPPYPLNKERQHKYRSSRRGSGPGGGVIPALRSSLVSIPEHNTENNTPPPPLLPDAYYYDSDDENDSELGGGGGGGGGESRRGPPRPRRQLPAQAYLGATIALLGLLAIGWLMGDFFTKIPQTLIDSSLDLAALTIPGFSYFYGPNRIQGGDDGGDDDPGPRPQFVYEHPYVSSSYYTSTKSIKTLISNEDIQVRRNLKLQAEEEAGYEPEAKTRLAIVRPFCEFDAEALPTTFTCWNALPPCKVASDDIGDDEDDLYELGNTGQLMAYQNNTAGRNLYENDNGDDRHRFDLVGSGTMKNAKADVFLFYSQTFSENDVAIKAVDTIIDQFFEPGGWSQCFNNIYAIEANIPQELDLYIPSAQEELYNWVNGPNRQFEAAFRIIQSGEWGEYDGFYLMEGDSVPIKAHWLDVVMSEIEVNRPFAILGAQYDGDKWDNFYEKIPISLLHHTNGNAIYNTSHPLLERLVGQLEVEAPCPYNSIPYDYRMSQMWVEGTLGIVPELAPKIMLNEEGENITLSNNVDMFNKWADIWEKEDPFKYTPVIHNYAATNLIPRHLGPEYIIHGAKLYSPWNPTKTEVTLVVSEWFFDRSLHLIKNLDEKDHPFSEVVVMVPPVAGSHDDYDQMSDVHVRTQHRGAPDFMDLCEADVKTDWFMITNSYHHVARHVDLMFTPGTFKPVIPFTPATYPFCFKFPYCKETINLAQRINSGHDKVVLDMDMLYNTKERNAFCKEWREENGQEGEDLYKQQQRRLIFRKKIIGPPGPTGTSYFAYLVREKKDGMYKMTDRSLYGARPPFVKIFAKEEKLDGMSEDELAKRVGMTLLDNSTDCNCGAFETEVDCDESGIGCIWRPLFESCHPPELIDGSSPICPTTQAPTMSPTMSLPFEETESPTTDVGSMEEEGSAPENDAWYTRMFKSREHDESNSTEDSTLMDDDAATFEPDDPGSRKLEADTQDPWYETDLSAEQRIDTSVEPRRKLEVNSIDSRDINDRRAQKKKSLPMKACDPWDPSIVPRHPTASNTWDGASKDLESRSFAAMAISRPRNLHGSFLQYQLLMSRTSSPNSSEQPSALSSILDDSSPLKDSWVTSTVPINVPKYAMYREGIRIKQVALDIPERDHKTFVNYGQRDDYQPLRITFATDHLLNYGNRHKSSLYSRKRSKPVTAATITQIEALTGDVLPAVSEIWAGALSVLRSIDNIFPLSDRNKCGEAGIPPHHLMQGVPDTDTLIYISVDGPQCYSDENSQGIISYATVCSFDQHLRPISANIDVCLSNVDVSFGEVPEEENLRLISTLTVEVGKVLGLSPSLFPHFRNSETGQPFGTTEKKVTCLDGTEQTLPVPNVLQSSLDLGISDFENGPSFQVTTPTVRQVIRNHFDCQSLLGARLSQGESSSCFGDTFDTRYHFDEDLTTIGGSADMAYSLSPLTLALLQDSGWYKAVFRKSTVPLFGRGAGCRFIEGSCIGESLTDHSSGFFCSDITEENHQDSGQPWGCDITHSHKADCSSMGESEPGADFCPMRMANIKSCSDMTNFPSLAGEMFSLNSRCFVTDAPASVCLESYCNSIDSKIDIVVEEKVYQCDYEGQELNLGSYIVKCPRLAVICPHLVCPANCSGKGVCDYCLETPQCVCDDPFDESPGCYGEPSVAETGNPRDADDEVRSTMNKLLQLMKASEYNEKYLREEDEELVNLYEEEMRHKAKATRLQTQYFKAAIHNLRDADIGTIRSTINELSQQMDVSEDIEKEMQEEDEELSNLHEKEKQYKDKIAMLISQSIGQEQNIERDLKVEDETMSNLNAEVFSLKANISMLHQNLKAAIRNARDADDETLRSTMKKISQMIDESEENEIDPQEDEEEMSYKATKVSRSQNHKFTDAIGNVRGVDYETFRATLNKLFQLMDVSEATEEALQEEDEDISNLTYKAKLAMLQRHNFKATISNLRDVDDETVGSTTKKLSQKLSQLAVATENMENNLEVEDKVIASLIDKEKELKAKVLSLTRNLARAQPKGSPWYPKLSRFFHLL